MPRAHLYDLEEHMYVSYLRGMRRAVLFIGSRYRAMQQAPIRGHQRPIWLYSYHEGINPQRPILLPGPWRTEGDGDDGPWPVGELGL